MLAVLLRIISPRPVSAVFDRRGISHEQYKRHGIYESMRILDNVHVRLYDAYNKQLFLLKVLEYCQQVPTHIGHVRHAVVVQAVLTIIPPRPVPARFDQRRIGHERAGKSRNER